MALRAPRIPVQNIFGHNIFGHAAGRTTAILAVAALLLAGCGSADQSSADVAGADPGAASTATASAEPSAPPSTDSSPDPSPDPDAINADSINYVALGDSFVAAPGVPESVPADGCYRSTHNYPSVIAATVPNVALTDVSCSGAASSDVVGKQKTPGGGEVTPQIDALTPQTDYVTLGIGGNDFNLFTQLLGTCYQVASKDPGGTPCRDAAGAKLDGTIAGIKTNVAGVLDAIEKAAPRSKVIVVGYPWILRGDSTCPDLVGIATGDYALVQEVTDRLDDALAAAATEAKATFADLRKPSLGHDVCAKDPWINGQQTAPDGTIPFHPFAKEQTRVAAVIAKLLR